MAHDNTWVEETAAGGPFEGAIGLRVVGGPIYVADAERGLLIFPLFAHSGDASTSYVQDA